MTDDMRLLAMHDADLAREVAELRKSVIRVLDNQTKSRVIAWLTRACWLLRDRLDDGGGAMGADEVTAGELQARIDRVLAMHVADADGLCDECKCWNPDYGPEGPRWPCATVRLLTGEADA